MINITLICFPLMCGTEARVEKSKYRHWSKIFSRRSAR